MDDFFDDIITFAKDDHTFGHGLHTAPHSHTGEPLSVHFAYYEWSAANQEWLKLNESDPDPDPEWAAGEFDGQILEFEA